MFLFFLVLSWYSWQLMDIKVLLCKKYIPNKSGKKTETFES